MSLIRDACMKGIMSIKSRSFYVLTFALFGVLVFPILWLVNSTLTSFELGLQIEHLIEGIQFFLAPGWLFQTLLLARSDGYVFPYPIQVIVLVNVIYWAIVGYITTSPKIVSYWLKIIAGLIAMFLLSNLILEVHGG